ncbi:MAG: type VI secretion system ATPase TssH [Planctomycetota bacterium]
MAKSDTALIGRLTQSARRGLAGAAGLAKSRTHDATGLEHWLVKLLERADLDVARVLEHFDVRPDTVVRELESTLDEFHTGNGGPPSLSPAIIDVARDAWLLASILYDHSRCRSGCILLAAMQHDLHGRRLTQSAPSLERLNLELIENTLPDIVAGSAEDREVTTGTLTSDRAVPTGAEGQAATPALDQYTVDLTDQAQKGKIDPVLGREGEIRQMVDILTRRRQNNPILTGEAGVGKTAVVEGLAMRIAAQDVPEPLRGVSVRTLDLGLLQAGAGVKGEFENRLKQVIEEVRSSPPIILFIDEAHTLIGAGGQEGQNDAANLLKPALARGELRTIAATTWAEYKKYFEKDAALSRRFQMVKVDEPDVPVAIRMMRGLCRKLEHHHRVRILDSAVEESVRLSARYLPARQLPDKSVSVLDTASARVAVGHAATPAPIEHRQREIEHLDRELATLQREAASGADHGERIAALEQSRAVARTELEQLEERWDQEKQLVADLLRVRARLEKDAAPCAEDSAEAEAGSLSEDERAQLQRELEHKRAQLHDLQGESPLVQPAVDGQTVAEVIAAWTGIPVGKMVANEIQTLLRLDDVLEERVLGQRHALEGIASRILISRARLDDPRRPVGVFLLAGPSGVGKTETGLALADAIYGGERNMVTINMSEYQEKHTVSQLKGSPPGYVGFGEGGVLTEAVRRRPHTVVLLDEVEKAHSDVMELFFQVFDKGVLEDGEGRDIDFKNTVILLTSNVGSDTIMKLCADPDTVPEPDGIVDTIRPELLRKFPAALLGRLVVLPYHPILPGILRQIVRLQLGRIEERLQANHGVHMAYDESLIERIAERCTEAESGARNVDRVLTQGMLPTISRELLARMANDQSFEEVSATMDESGRFQFEIR